MSLSMVASAVALSVARAVAFLQLWMSNNLYLGEQEFCTPSVNSINPRSRNCTFVQPKFALQSCCLASDGHIPIVLIADV